MAAVGHVLIVGAGIGGLALAIALRERGIVADVIEVETQTLGLGITLTGTTLRASIWWDWPTVALGAASASIFSW